MPGDDWGNNVVEAHFWEGTVSPIERKGKEKAEGEGEHDPLVSATDAEEIA